MELYFFAKKRKLSFPFSSKFYNPNWEVYIQFNYYQFLQSKFSIIQRISVTKKLWATFSGKNFKFLNFVQVPKENDVTQNKVPAFGFPRILTKNSLQEKAHFYYCSDCEPCTKLDELRTAAVLADVYDRELVLTIGWAKQVIQV